MNSYMTQGFAESSVIVGITIAIAVLLIPAYLWFFPYLHNRTLNEFSESLTAISLPPETHKVAELSKIGQQIGNSDHCDYFSGQMLQTYLPKGDFEAYYRTHYSGKSQVEFVWINEKNKYTTDSQFDPTIIHPLKDWLNDKSQNNKDANVVVYIFEAGMTSALDLRCS